MKCLVSVEGVSMGVDLSGPQPRLTVSDETAKVSADNGVPGGALPGIELDGVSAVVVGRGRAGDGEPLS